MNRALQSDILGFLTGQNIFYIAFGKSVRIFGWMSIVGETKLAILMHLNRGPSHGYEIAKEVEISHGGVYTHLQELEDADLIEMLKKEDDKKIYRLTENGEMFLEALGELD